MDIDNSPSREDGAVLILVGERANTARARGDYSDPARWADVCLRAGAFRDDQSQKRLRAIGAEWHGSLNLLPPGRAAESPWEPAYAKVVASVVEKAVPRGRLLLCGRRVQSAFGVAWSPPYGYLVGRRYLCLPHPSGLSRFWNDASAVLECEIMTQRGVDLLNDSWCAVCDHPCWSRLDTCQGCKKTVCPHCCMAHGDTHRGERHLTIYRE